ncbi:MAG TPA: NIPSNAP family protein [Burkholderiaceae bacterium]|jgi:hypothetical protein
MTTTPNPATVFELRNYTLHPGQRDTLITLFEREFIEAQQDCGITLPGLFTDMDRPDHFVWLRGFADMAARPAALGSFYTGPVWQAHREQANATMIDSDDVLLLKPFGAAPVTGGQTGQLFLAIDCRLVGDNDVLAALEDAITAHLDGDVVGRWTTDTTPNNFPRLPVREGERHAVWLLRLPKDLDAAARASLTAALEPWSDPQLLRLQPTVRSELQLDPGAPRYIGRPGDFDFLVGRWSVRNRRLMTRLRGNTSDWREFDAMIEAWSHMGGQVSFDEIHFESEGFSGATMRSLDMQTKQWSIYWINSRSGKVFPPVQGGWCGARGEFYGVDEDDGRTVLVRFVWERVSANALRWTQAFSIDGGRSWEDNWRMEMSRL